MGKLKKEIAALLMLSTGWRTHVGESSRLRSDLGGTTRQKSRRSKSQVDLTLDKREDPKQFPGLENCEIIDANCDRSAGRPATTFDA
jgi:hypothetical protein